MANPKIFHKSCLYKLKATKSSAVFVFGDSLKHAYLMTLRFWNIGHDAMCHNVCSSCQRFSVRIVHEIIIWHPSPLFPFPLLPSLPPPPLPYIYLSHTQTVCFELIYSYKSDVRRKFAMDLFCLYKYGGLMIF